MGDHVLGIRVCDGRKISEGLLLAQIITHSKPWHFDWQLLELRFSEVVRALDVLHFIIISVCILRRMVGVLGWCSPSWCIGWRCRPSRTPGPWCSSLNVLLSLVSAVIVVSVSRDGAGMLLLLEVMTGLRSRSVSVHVWSCHVVSWVTLLLLPDV